MADSPKLTTAAEMEAMTAQERSALLREHIVTDLEELSPAQRTRILATGERLARERRTAHDV